MIGRASRTASALCVMALAAGLAGCSSGAFRKIDQTIRKTEHKMSEMSSV